MPKANFPTTKPVTNLMQAIISLENIDEARRFFRDLLTEGELLEFANRWRVAQMLQIKIPYSQIESQTGMSSTTIARINKWLTNGMGGYQLLLNRLSVVKPSPRRRGLGEVFLKKPANNSKFSNNSRFLFGTTQDTHHHHSHTTVESGP